MTLEVGVRKAVCAEIQQRESTKVPRTLLSVTWKMEGEGQKARGYSSPGRGSGRSTRH